MEEKLKGIFFSSVKYLKYLFFIGLMLILTSLPDLFLFVGKENLIIVLLYIFVSSLIIIFLVKKYDKRLDTNIFRFRGENFWSKKKILFTALMYAVMWVIDFIFDHLILLETPENQEVLEDIFGESPIILAISVVLVAPIVEELIFRGIFTNYFLNFQNKYSKWIVLLSSSLLFGLAHEVEPSMSLLYYSSVGGVLWLTYFYTKDLRYSMILHFINNSVALYYMYVS